MPFQSYHRTEYAKCEDCGTKTIKGNVVCLSCLVKRSKRPSTWDTKENIISAGTPTFGTPSSDGCLPPEELGHS